MGKAESRGQSSVEMCVRRYCESDCEQCASVCTRQFQSGVTFVRPVRKLFMETGHCNGSDL